MERGGNGKGKRVDTQVVYYWFAPKRGRDSTIDHFSSQFVNLCTFLISVIVKQHNFKLLEF